MDTASVLSFGFIFVKQYGHASYSESGPSCRFTASSGSVKVFLQEMLGQVKTLLVFESSSIRVIVYPPEDFLGIARL